MRTETEGLVRGNYQTNLLGKDENIYDKAVVKTTVLSSFMLVYSSMWKFNVPQKIGI